MARLFSSHPPAMQVMFSDLKRQAGEQTSVLTGTPGSLSRREVNGRWFWYRQYYDAEDRKAADYVGAADDEIEPRIAALRARIATANELLASARLLARAGYVRVDARTDAILAALSNHALFRAGGMLVGSHAYGALLNDVGARAAGFATEDVDIARDRALDLGDSKTFAEMLTDSRVTLHPVPSLDRAVPSSSFKGPNRLRVDLLVPTRGDAVKVLEVTDLKAHATALPYFAYLLADPLDTVVLGRSAVIAVKVPRPERLAWHKMLVSELRHRENDKRQKDIDQAAVLVAILAEREPGALEEASRELPSGARSKVRAAAAKVIERLASTGHDRAAETLRGLA